MRKAVMLTVIVVASIVAACGDGGEAETTPTPSEQPTATAEASLTVTPSPGPMGTPTPRPLTLEDADQYFDVTAVLPPDFIRVDPVAEGFEHPQEPGYSDMVMYKSQSRTQLEFIHMFMFLASGETEKTMQRLMLENDELLAYAFNVNFTDEGMEVNSEFQEVDVGDMAKMACVL